MDISVKMVERSRKRANKERIADRVEFRVADAQELPFEDAVFNAVITESVTAFPEDKQKAVGEYVRVTKPGGYVGLNESVWRKEPVPEDVIVWVSQDIGFTVRPLTRDAWTHLLQSAGLREITVRTYAINAKDEARGILRRYGLAGMLRVYGRILLLYAQSPAYRGFVKSVRETGVLPENLEEYFGYGLFVGRK